MSSVKKTNEKHVDKKRVMQEQALREARSTNKYALERKSRNDQAHACACKAIAVCETGVGKGNMNTPLRVQGTSLDKARPRFRHP